jgi:hypothetical protein
MEVIPWLEARGVSRARALAWYRGRYHAETGFAEVMFGNAQCRAATLGDDAEAAAVCETAITYSWMQIRVFAIVVRRGTITPVLDVGLGMRSLDEPSSRDLDLALSFSPDGRSALLRDRAADGTRLVEAQSACRARETMHGHVPMREGFPSILHGCASAKGDLASTEAEMSKQGGWRVANEAHIASRFVERTCSEVGMYAWRNGRFVVERSGSSRAQ